MGIISDSINKRRNLRSDDGAVTRAERAEHHNYQEELTAFLLSYYRATAYRNSKET